MGGADVLNACAKDDRPAPLSRAEMPSGVNFKPTDEIGHVVTNSPLGDRLIGRFPRTMVERDQFSLGNFTLGPPSNGRVSLLTGDHWAQRLDFRGLWHGQASLSDPRLRLFKRR